MNEIENSPNNVPKERKIAVTLDEDKCSFCTF